MRERDTPEMYAAPRISVVIRNRNESQHLRHVLRALSEQRPHRPEIILVDNESDDDSVAVALEFGASVISIARSSFTYGSALNRGLAAATGELCVILSAHSLPLGSSFLEECAKPFADERVAAARCVYVGKSADLTRWMEPKVLDGSATIRDVVAKGPLASGCVIRRMVWEEIPFDERAEAAEEKLWAAEVLRRGHRIYSPCPAFYVYMKRLSASQELRKNARELRQIYRSTGARLGSAQRSFPGSLLDLGRAIFVAAPRAAIEVVARESLRVYLRFSSLRGQAQLSSVMSRRNSSDKASRTRVGVLCKKK
jgi:glycosyltransferase involved in cell wall biosynthesis